MNPKPTLFEKLGGAFGAAIAVASVVVAVIAAIGIPAMVDMNNAFPLFWFAIACMLVGYFNGFRARGSYEGVSKEEEARIEQMRLDREAERRRLDADAAAERQRLKDESDARIRREDEEIRKTTQAETIRLNMFAALSKAEADVVRKIADSSDGMTYVHNDELVISLMKKKVAYTTSQYGGTVPVMLTEAWQLIMNTHRDEFEAVRKLVKDDK